MWVCFLRTNEGKLSTIPATVRYIVIGGVRQPLSAECWNPRYRAGIRHCAAALARKSKPGRVDTYVFEDEVLHVESDMWALAEAVLQMSIPERIEHGWPEIGWD